MSGYARAYRKRWDHPLFKNKQEAAVWAWMTDTARFRAHEFQTRFGIVRLERGQLLLSERTIADDFGLGRQQVRRLMDSFENASMINRDSTHSASRAGTIITIVNYEHYQGDRDEPQAFPTQGQPNQEPKGNPRPTQDQPTREEREKREEREEERPSVSSIGKPTDASIEMPEPGKPAEQASSIIVLSLADPIVDAFSAYQSMRGELVPNARTVALTAGRKRKLADRIREIGGGRAWLDVLAQIRGSPFLRGETSRNGFVAEIDWLLQPANLTKVREGTFDDKRDHNRRQNTDTASPIDAMRAARTSLGYG